MSQQKVTKLAIDAIRVLSMDGVQAANSGHPGTPMALADAAYVLWKDVMKHNPKNPTWMNRDRFILSNGHASMLIYSMLHLCGYDLPLKELKDFRQLGSKTPGHPEYGHTPGVETTTGPLGQGIMTAVGMAMAEKHLAARFNKKGHNIIDHHTYVFCSDGDLMEGASHEAASIAGHVGLGKLICLYDDNKITIEGETDLAFSEDIGKRFEACGWQVIDLGDKGTDIKAIAAAYKKAKANTKKPSMIILRTHIGYGSPNMVDTSEVHGSPMGRDEINLTKKQYDYPSLAPFHVPASVKKHYKSVVTDGKKEETAWKKDMQAYKKAHPELASQLAAFMEQAFPKGWDKKIPTFKPEQGPMATRNVNSNVINAVADTLPWFVGGSADLNPSTKTFMKSSPYFSKKHPEGRNFAWGIREMVMCAASTGMMLHGGLRPFTATFFVFTDYARPAIRLAALMNQPVIYVMTHDSIGLGEDGPTHQPVEHLASLRAMPNLTVIRPADANETTYAWRAALKRTAGPSMLVLSRQKLPILDRKVVAPARETLKGAYILSKEKGATPDVILMASGSEVELVLEAQQKLAKSKIDARVVSFPSWEMFDKQSASYKAKVLPPAVTARISVEAGSTMGWMKYVGTAGIAMGVNDFGISAPYKLTYKKFGLTASNIAAQAKKLVKTKK